MSIPVTLTHAALFLCLSSLGIAATHWGILLYDDFVFTVHTGIALLALVWFDYRVALAVVFISHLPTLISTPHPIHIIVDSSTVIFIAWQRYRHPAIPLAVASVRYWLLIGIPLVYAIQYATTPLLFTQLGASTAQQAAVGIMNAIIAGICVTGSALWRRQDAHHLPFYFLATFLLLPLIGIIAVHHSVLLPSTATPATALINALLLLSAPLYAVLIAHWCHRRLITLLAHLTAVTNRILTIPDNPEQPFALANPRLTELTPVTDTLRVIATAFARYCHDCAQQHAATTQLLTQLQHSETRWASAQRIANMGSWYFDCQTHEVQWSEHTYELLDYQPYSVKPAWKYFIARIHPQDRRRLRLRLARLEQLDVTEVMIEEVRLLLPHQQVRVLSTQTRTQRDANGVVTSFEGILLDITAREQINHTLATERQRLANVIDGPRLGTWEWHLDNDEMIFNEHWAALCGYQLNELAPTSIATWRQLAHPEDLEISDMLMDYHLRGHVDRYDCEIRMHHKQGHWVWVLNQGRIVAYDHAQQPQIVAGTSIDITTRKRIELDLMRRENLEHQLVECAADLLAPVYASIATAIAHTLAQMSELIGAERSYLGILDNEQQVFQLQHCWQAEVLSNDDVAPTVLPLMHFPFALKQLQHQQPVILLNCNALTSEWEQEQQWLLAQGVQSLILVPIADNNELHGMMGFEMRTAPQAWRNSDVRFLQVFANLCANAFSRERSDRALRTSEQRLRAVFDNAPIGISIMDTAQRLIYVNRAFAEFVGRDLNSLPGHTVRDFIHIDDIEREQPLFNALLAGERPSYRLEKRYVRPNGEIVWGDMRVNLLPRHDQQTPLPLGMVEDITELRAATAHQRHLEAQLTRYAAHLEQLVDISAGRLPVEEEITTLMRFGCTCLCADAATLGQCYDQLAYTPLFTVFLSEQLTMPKQLLESLPAQLFGEQLQHLNTTPWVPHIVPITTAASAMAASEYALCISLFIPEVGTDAPATQYSVLILWSRAPHITLEHLERQLLRLIGQRIVAVRYDERVHNDLVAAKERETIGHFASGIAHDFNNLLGAIDANLYFVNDCLQAAEEAPVNEDVIEALTETRSVIGHAKVMTAGLLSLSRAGGISSEQVVLSPLLEELTAILQQILPSHIHLQVAIEPGLCTHSNGAFLQAALLNLALNARDAMPSGGDLILTAARTYSPPIDVRIGTPPTAPYIVVSMCDTGYGMSAAVLARIFEPLFSTKARQRGHGLGLFMVQEFIVRTHAALAVTSQPEQGTTFALLLPCQCSLSMQDMTQDEQRQVQPLSTIAQRMPLRILLVDDDVRMRDSLARLLTAAGFQLTIAEHGEAALMQLRLQPAIDLVLSDINMPVLDGVALVRALAQERPGLPVILMTGRDSGSQFLQDGGDQPLILLKPLDMQALALAIQQRLHV